MALTTDDIDGLKELLEKTEEFTSDIFDWVAPLGHQSQLGQLYSFRQAIADKIQELEAQSDDA